MFLNFSRKLYVHSRSGERNTNCTIDVSIIFARFSFSCASTMELIYVQVALMVTGEETYEREFGNLKLIKDNYPKYVVTMDPNVGLIHDSGIVACSARQFLLTH